jgi:TfoX/Sxy family transcriptional regulator of competence genes
MPYDEEFAERVRSALGPVPGVTEIKMFGGLCYTIGGNMAVGVTGEDLMVRMDPDAGDAALAEPGARPMDFTGRPMRGFLYVGPEGTRTARSLERWVDRGVAFASSLPPKKPKSKKPRPPKA